MRGAMAVFNGRDTPKLDKALAALRDAGLKAHSRAFAVAKAVGRHMIRRKRGSIINICSGFPAHPPYPTPTRGKPP